MGFKQAGTFYNAAAIASDDSFTYDSATNTITTGVDDQVFTLKDPENNTAFQANSFVFGAVGTDITVLMENKAYKGIIIANGETKGYDNAFNLLTFTVSGLAGKVFSFECIR